MSAASIRLINSLPTDGALGLPVGTEINSLTPLGVGDLVLRPSSPGDGPATETIEITTELVGVAFPGIGMTRLEAGTTAFPMLIVIASRGALPCQITLRSSAGGGGGGSATAANQVLGLTALDSIYDALTLVGTEATSTQILGALTALKGTSTLDDLAAGLTAISGGASQADIKTALETQGVDIGLTLAAVNTLITNTDGIETLLAAIQAGTDKIPLSPAQDRTTAAAPSATRASNGTAFIDLALDTTVAAVTTAVNAAKAVLDTIYTRLADGNQVAVVRGNVADNSPAALPVTIGGEDTGGKSWPIVGANVGSGLQPFVQVTNNVAVQTPAGGTVATEATLSALNAKVLTSTADPATTDAGVRVRQIPAFTAGKQVHAQTSVGVANAANKLLFGFYNNTGSTVYIGRVHASNTQTANIAGVLCQLNVQVALGTITGGTTVDGASSPALVAACRNITNTVPATLVFNTGGAFANTPSTISSVCWSTDEITPNGTGVANEVFALGSVMDVWDFCDDPVVVPNGYSFAVVCDAAATNGTTLVDFNIYRT